MAGITFKAELSDQAARERLDQLVDRMENVAGFYKGVGEYMTDEAIPRNFASETAPDGKPWASLRPVTIARREKAGRTPITILRASGGMAAGINSRVTDEGLLVGSPAPQAAVMQFGAGRGSLGATSRGSPIPWGDIPARPFLGFSAEDEREVIRIAEDWLES